MPNYYIKESSDKPCPMRKYLDFGASGFAIITTLLPLIVFFEKKLGHIGERVGHIGEVPDFQKTIYNHSSFNLHRGSNDNATEPMTTGT